MIKTIFLFLVLLIPTMHSSQITLNEQIEALSSIESNSVGFNQVVGQFYLVSLKVAKSFSFQQIVHLTKSKNPVIRMLGFTVILVNHPHQIRHFTEEFLHDKSEIVSGSGCDYFHKTVGEITLRLLDDPFCLGHVPIAPINSYKPINSNESKLFRYLSVLNNDKLTHLYSSASYDLDEVFKQTNYSKSKQIMMRVLQNDRKSLIKLASRLTLGQDRTTILLDLLETNQSLLYEEALLYALVKIDTYSKYENYSMLRKKLIKHPNFYKYPKLVQYSRSNLRFLHYIKHSIKYQFSTNLVDATYAKVLLNNINITNYDHNLQINFLGRNHLRNSNLKKQVLTKYTELTSQHTNLSSKLLKLMYNDKVMAIKSSVKSYHKSIKENEIRVKKFGWPTEIKLTNTYNHGKLKPLVQSNS